MATILTSRQTRVSVLIVTLALLLTPLVSDRPADAVSPGVDVVYVADGRNFADALVGAALAAANNTAVLTVAGTKSGDSVPQATKDELTRLKPKSIVVLGGTAAVSQAVEDELATYTDPPGNTSRLEGNDRYATAAAISAAMPDSVKRALFADEAGDADTLAGMEAAAFARSPLRTRHGPFGLVLADSHDNSSQGDLAGQRVYAPTALSPTWILGSLDAPFDAGPTGVPTDTFLWGKLTGLSICYRVEDAADAITTVELFAAEPGTDAPAQLGPDISVSLNSTDVDCASVPLPTDDALAAMVPLSFRLVYEPSATGPLNELHMYGLVATWEPYTGTAVTP